MEGSHLSGYPLGVSSLGLLVPLERWHQFEPKTFQFLMAENSPLKHCWSGFSRKWATVGSPMRTSWCLHIYELHTHHEHCQNPCLASRGLGWGRTHSLTTRQAKLLLNEAGCKPIITKVCEGLFKNKTLLLAISFHFEKIPLRVEIWALEETGLSMI